MKTTIFALAAMLLAARIPAASQNRDRLFPSDSGIVNVLDYGAAGDGVTDDTQAIRAAMLSRKRDYNRPLIVYFPAGVYLVSDTLEWRNLDGTFYPYITFQGQNSATTAIRLRDAAPGFGNTQAPKAVISTDSSAANPSPIGEGNEAYRNNIYDLSILTGSGNPGAVGIDYVANNRGSIGGVVIQSGDGFGHAGLSMTRHWPGPCLIKNVQIVGFDYGIDVNRYEYGITLEHVTLANQRVVGLRLTNNTIFARDLSSSNDVVAIRTSANSLLILVDSHLAGISSASASLNAIENGGVLVARNVTATGYQAAINDRGTLLPSSSIAEYASSRVLRPFSISTTSLGLAIAETPVTIYDDPAGWASVVAFGATPDNPNDDDGPAIQAAIDSGSSTIYFPQGAYHVRDTIHIRGNVRTIVGMDSYIWTAKRFNGDGRPLLRFEGGAQDAVTIENLAIRSDGPSVVALEHAGAQALVLNHVLLAGTVADYRNSPDGTGNLFIEDSQIGKMRIAGPQSVWARQLNAESSTAFPEPKIVNDGGTLWIGGIKTEQANTVIETKNGGQTELLGALLYPAGPVSSNTPALINRDSSVWAVYATSAYAAGNDYNIQIAESRAGMTRDVMKNQVLRRGDGSIVLYAGVPPVDTSASANPGGAARKAAAQKPLPKPEKIRKSMVVDK